MQLLKLHNRTVYTPLTSIITVKQLVEFAKCRNDNAIAIVDDSNLYGAVEFYKECKNSGIKPIIGTSLLLCEDLQIKDRDGFKLVFLAKNINGYRNLCKLITEAYKNFYYQPRIDINILAEYCHDLICLTGANDGLLYKCFIENKLVYLDIVLDRLHDLFHEDLYYELNYSVGKYGKYAQFIKDKFENNKIIHTDSSSFKGVIDNHNYFRAYEVLELIKNRRSSHIDYDSLIYNRLSLNRYPIENGLFYDDIHVGTESVSGNIDCNIFSGTQLAKNCSELNDKINLVFETHPVFPTPILSNGQSADEEIRSLLNDGWAKRKDKLKYASRERYRDRLYYEISTITKLGYVDYFIVVSNIVKWAKFNGILVGPGRGSAAGSLLSYMLGITEVDPLRYNLIFERFLDPTGSRVSPPDIDIDFMASRRHEVIDYITETYGAENVACVGNHTTLSLKAAIKDVGRVFGVEFDVLNEFTKSIPFGIKTVIELLASKKFRFKYKTKEFKEKIVKILAIVEHYDGVMKNISTHAAGIIICPSKITDYSPIQNIKSLATGVVRPTTQLDKDACEYLGLMKMDLLGLSALDTINMTLRSLDPIMSVDDIDIEDKNVYKLYSSGDTVGIFQMEGGGITELAKQVKPTCLMDVCDLIALYRPAVLDSELDKVYLENKDSGINTPIHYSISDITESTHGIILYQEQTMKAAVAMAGFSLAEADTLRKIIGKKDPKLLPEMKEKFLSGCSKNHIDQHDAESVFSIFENAVRYQFNMSHSLSYAILSVQTAALKYRYKTRFHIALLNTEIGNFEKINKYIEYCASHLDVGISFPSINHSIAYFRANGCIIYPLSAIKGIGKPVVDAILFERNTGGSFYSLKNFISRMINAGKFFQYINEYIILAQSLVFKEIESNVMYTVNVFKLFAKKQNYLIKNNNSLFTSTIDITQLVDIGSLKKESDYSKTEISTMLEQHIGKHAKYLMRL